MNLNATIESLEKLKNEVSLELEYIHEEVWKRERLINGLIDSRIYELEDDIREQVEQSLKEGEKQGILRAASNQ